MDIGVIAGGLLTHAHAAVGAKADPTLWYVTRTAAVAAYIALAATAIIGILRSIARQMGERISWAADEAHQFVALLAAILIIGHLVTLLLDPFLTFAPVNLLVPGDQPYRALAVNVGVFALYATAIVLVSSWLRRSVSYGFWRALHYLSFVAFALVTVHGLLAGSDNGEPWMLALYGGSTAAIAFLIVVRLVMSARGNAATARSGQRTI